MSNRMLLITIAALSAATALQAPAYAATPVTIGATSTFTIAPVSGMFSDSTTFALAPGSSVFLSFSGSSTSTFSALTALFYDTATHSTAIPISGLNTNLISGMLMPTAGNFNTLVIQGLTAGTGAINGSLTVLSAAVPELSTWAMMTVGFGALGYSLRRRSTNFDLA